MFKVPFTLLRIQPDNIRGETMNVGLVTFLPEGARIYFDAPAARLKAFHPDFEHIRGEQWALEIEEALSKIKGIESQLEWLQNSMGAIKADSKLGSIAGDTQEDITNNVELLLERFVHVPEREVPAVHKHAASSRTVLKTQLKSWFRRSNLFSSKVSDLSQKRIVPNYPIDANDDLYADFAMKNGSIHVLEVIDFRGVERITRGLRGEASLTAILLDQVKKRFSEESKRIAITAADDYKKFASLMNIVGGYADDMVAIESATDRQRLADFISASLNAKNKLLPEMQMKPASAKVAS